MPSDHSRAAGVCLAACVSLVLGAPLLAQRRATRAPAQIVTGTYGQCNPVVDDTLAGAEARSPSDCEIKFDADVRRAFNRAFAGLTTAFPSGAWIVHLPAIRPITHQARHTETSPYRMDWSSEGAYVATLQMAPGSPAFAAYQQQEQQALNAPHPDVAALATALHRVEFETKARIAAVVNYPYGIADNFTTERTPLTIDGARFAFFAPHVQAPTGGDIGGSQPTTFIWLGRWSGPVIRRNSDDSEHIELRAAFAAGAPPLSVQNVQIRITAAEPLARQIVGAMDLAAIRDLLPK